MDQSIFGSLPYIPGSAVRKPEALSRYLPPIPNGIISTWLRNNIPQGSWILDPFCASPRLVVEAAQAGYRLLVTANNPISRFLLEMAANPPKSEDLKSILAELAASYKADERIEPHIRSLYNTYCARCGQLVSADAFLWEHGNPLPYCRIYSCPSCGDTGEHPCTPYDASRISQFSTSGLHKARALERVVASSDQDRIHVEQALLVYIPRALYALVTIINKIEGLHVSPAGQKYLSALLLHAFDQANALWRVPGPKERRRQLTIPRHFRENNIWKALEEGVDLWSAGNTDGQSTAVPVSTWPTLPPESGGICIYEGRLVSIAESLAGLHIKSVCAAIPRPNQAYWTLSALWAGWLWGRDAVSAIKSVLHRQRYDWGWHTSALSSVFKQLVNLLEPNTKILGILGEAEPGFIASALVSAKMTGCSLEGLAIRPEEEQAQIVWSSTRTLASTRDGGSLTQAGISAAVRYLENRGEPASYFNTICAALMNITMAWNAGLVPASTDKKDVFEKQTKVNEPAEAIEPTPSLVYSTIYNSAREALTYRSGFLRLNVQDTANVELPNKTQIVQDTLFSLDTGNINPNPDEDEAPNPELPLDESESTSEKERPTRSSDISESLLLWLRDAENVNHFSITDSYELAFVNYQTTHPGCTEDDINAMMCGMFTGLYTPDPEFIRMCMDSYGEKAGEESEQWYIRTEDQPTERQKDLEATKKYIQSIGERLGILSIDHSAQFGKPTILWVDKSGKLDYWFFLTISATIGETVLYSELSSKKGFVVLPGSRTNLVMYKLRRDPRLVKAFNPSQGNWNFLKFRHLRSLVENPLLNRENLDALLQLDPLTFSTPQLRLI
jgi:hypothetical protein